MTNQTQNFLVEEYRILQEQYEDFDRRALQIKGWIGAGSIAGIALGGSPDNVKDREIWMFIAAISASFWYLEATWKLFQQATSDRIRIIEAYFRGDETLINQNVIPFQIFNYWTRSYVKDLPIYNYEEELRPRRRYARLARLICRPSVCLPYALIIGICVVRLVS